jgi:colicin import membrane protein
MSENAARNSSHSEPKRLTAGVLALLVHAVFIAVLVFGLSWKDHPPEGMMVDIWTELPQPMQAPPKQTKPVKPEPQPEPPKPEPPKPEPPKSEPPKPEPSKPEPVKPEPLKPAPQKPAVTPPVKKPDIAMKQKPEPEPELVKEAKPDLEEQKKKEQEKIKEQERLKELEKKKALEKQKELETQKELERQKELQKQKEKELAVQRQRDQEAKARQAAEAQRAAEAQQAAARSQVTNEISKYKALILAKIKSRIVMPPDLPGNPAVEFNVTLLPGGDILDVRLARSSGHAVFDSAVERAIFLSKPLPLPSDSSLFNEFRNLNIKVHYRE